MLDRASAGPTAEEVMELNEVLGQLDAAEREVLLYAYMGLTATEIGVIAGCGSGAMEKRIERARAKARGYLRGESVGPATQSAGDLHAELERLLAIAKEQIPDVQERAERRGRKPKRRDGEEDK